MKLQICNNSCHSVELFRAAYILYHNRPISPMHIVIIDKEELLEVSGVMLYAQRLSDHLLRHGHTVSFIRYSNKKNVAKNIYQIPYYYADPRTFVIAPSEKTPELIRKYLIKLQPDLIYCFTFLSIFDFSMPSIAHELGIPIVSSMHQDINEFPSLYQFVAKSIHLTYIPFFKQLDLLHVFSEKVKNLCIKWGVNEQSIIVLPNGVDNKLYSPGESHFAKTHAITKGVLFVGRVTLLKNPEVLLKAFLKIPEEKGTKLVVVGTGELLDKLKEKYTSPRILFTGIITDELEKIDIIRSCQLFVQPSLFEGMSLALLESISCGLVPITSDAGNNGQVVRDCGGIVIPVDHIESKLSQEIAKQLHSPDLLKRGQAARQRIEKNYDQSAIFDALIARFSDLVKAKTSAYAKSSKLS